MMLLLSLVVGVFAQTEAPTKPTMFPTVTPAPESKCLYMDTDNGPFALDCLQDEFIKIGCSIRGDSYPTETREDTEDDDPEADKKWYNANTWAQVKTQLQAVKDADGNDCNGDDSNVPSESPTAEPTTKSPTPSPSIPPTLLTPSPTFGPENVLSDLYSNDGSSPDNLADTAAAVKQACEDAGYARQYDMTQYVVALTIGDNTDYFTIVPEAQDSGFPVSICDMLADPDTQTTLWSDKIDGPFIEVDITQDTPTMFDNRVYPSWLNRGDDGAGGYGGLSGAASGGKAYTLKITSYRTNSMCRERVVPQTETTGDSPVFDEGNTHCARQGGALQDWTNTAEVCQGEDATALHYALANRMYSTCDDFCVYSPDYEDDKANNEFWFWVAGSDCWKPRSQYDVGAFQECDTEHEDFTDARQLAYDHVKLRAEMLCAERCDYVGGFTYDEGSCYIALPQSVYAGADGDVQAEKAQTYCDETYGGNLASIADKAEQMAGVAVCDGEICYIGNNPATKGTKEGNWRDGSLISYVNFWGGAEGESFQDGNYLTLQVDGSWRYTDGDSNFKALCEVPADTDAADSNEAAARACVVDNGDHDETSVPALNVADSGFTDKDNPGNLHFIVEVPQTMYNTRISFEGATNDAGEYHWSYANQYWDLKTAATGCDEDNVYEGAIPWTVFNLGGAGGVSRSPTWTDGDGNVQTTDDEENDDGSNAKYIFLSVMRIQATVPVQTSIDTDTDPQRALRVAQFDREVSVLVPFVLQFQKTVTVTTEVDIISTKFNYKTVAAIIQSIQYETQYFQPPYAKVMLQIRTKSQYPYLFNKDETTIKLYPVDGNGNTNTNVNMTIEWLQDDTNCTFTNPDHMREGDVCTQEWMLYLTPNDNVCYATGEYTIEYLAGCFYGKDVCYLPFDNNGDEIETVSFTFKIQTSKFCPDIADEVDLAGTLTVTGRESFKPADESVEGDTEGSMYFQGETIHLFATTSSQKAVITSTKVVMVELEQDLSGLVQTGFNRVPFDETSDDLTIWTEPGAGRVADGTVTIDDGEEQTEVELMTDDDVYASGSDFGEYTFSATEAGFKILLHARAFPVNVDSFDSKKIIATLEVEYEALGIRRRRLLATAPNTDLRTETSMRLNAFRGQSMPQTHGESASMSLFMTLQANVNRGNVKAFTDSFRDAVVTALNDDPQSQRAVYESQVAVDAVWTDGSRIWSRPRDHRFGSRRLLEITPTQRLRVDFTFANVAYANAMPLDEMVNTFYKQLKQPASQLMGQNIFLGSVVHKCIEAPVSDYRPPTALDGSPGMRDSELASAAPMAIPFALFGLLAALLF